MRGGRRTLLFALIALTTLIVPAPAARADVVERRGGATPLTGTVRTINDAGVTIEPPAGRAKTVPWDRVRAVDRIDPDPRLDAFMQTATDLWRARSRVQRRDFALAEPLLSRLFEQYRGRTHETALVVAEGLLRCRLARGANAAAVVPALEVARLREAGVTTEVYGALREVIDAETRLCPALVPAWGVPRAAARMERELAEYDAGEDRVLRHIAAIYRAAVQRQLGAPVSPLPEQLAAEPGVTLLADVVACGAADPAQRSSARGRLLQTLDERPRWARAWIHLATGASLLADDGRGQRQRGMVRLLRLPVHYGDEHPYLGALALRWVAESSREAGDTETAEIMDAELGRRYPVHPVRTAEQPLWFIRTEARR